MGLKNEHDIAAQICREPASLSSSQHSQAVCIDYLSILSLALLTLGIWVAPMYYVEDRIVPLWRLESGGSLHGPDYQLRPPIELEYPWGREPLPSWSCGFIVVCVPLLVIAAFQIRSRHLWDFHARVVGVLQAVVATALVVTILKQFIGGFRPYFIEACKPDTGFVFRDVGKERYWMNATACTGAQYDVKKAMQSFPSGHTANSFAAAVFTSLFLNAKLKVFADRASNMWSLILTIAPLIGASLVSGSMYLSHQHHGDDIVFGMIIGLSLGILSYRSRYTAVFDFRYNHIPLPPHTSHDSISCVKDFSRNAVETITQAVPTKDVDISVWSRSNKVNQTTSWLQSISTVKVNQ